MVSLTKIGLLVSLAEINTKKGQYTTATEQDIGHGKAILLNDFWPKFLPLMLELFVESGFVRIIEAIGYRG